MRRWEEDEGSCESETKLLVKGFALIIEPTVHGAGAGGEFACTLMGRLGVRIKGCLLEDYGEYCVFGYDCGQ